MNSERRRPVAAKRRVAAAAADAAKRGVGDAAASDLRRLLADNRVEWGDLLIADLNGIFRGKRFAAADFAALADGRDFGWPGSVFAVSVDGRCVEETGCGARVGDPDSPARLVGDGVELCPWREPPQAQARFEIIGEDGDLFFADPRAVLRRVIGRYAADGWTPVLAAELEFYLYLPGESPLPVEPAPRVYSADKVAAFADFWDRCFACARAQGVAADSVIGEYAPGQFEINLRHRADAERAATDALLLRRLVRESARGCGMGATFLSKPFAGCSGSGLHFHLSVLDRRGRNIFADAQGGASRRLFAAVAGALDIIGEGFAFFAPFANSYRRFVAGSYAPARADWAAEDRNAALRLPRADGESRRLEFRLPGADANPYLAAAALLAGAHRGIKKGLTPPPPRDNSPPPQGDSPPRDKPTGDIPLTWRAALDNLAAARILPDYLGADFVKFFLAVKESEWRHHRDHISDYDRMHYLTAV